MAFAWVKYVGKIHDLLVRHSKLGRGEKKKKKKKKKKN
jgi:hypothetical protein